MRIRARKKLAVSLLGVAFVLATIVSLLWTIIVIELPHQLSIVTVVGITILTTFSMYCATSKIFGSIRQFARDSLLGVMTRNTFLSNLDSTIEHARVNNSEFYLIILDIIDFKQFNDVLGTQVGNTIITDVAAHIKEIVSSPNMVARLSSSEFAIVITKLNKGEVISNLANRLILHCNVPIMLDSSKKILPKIRLGISSYPDMGTTAEDLIRTADIAVNNANKNQLDFSIYSPDSAVPSSTYNLLINELLTGLKNDEFEMVVQPKLNVKTGTYESVECLIRWNHPMKGVMYPESFIHIAESAGVIKYITQFAISKATQIYSELHNAGYELSIGVNISPNDMSDPTIMTNIIKNIVTNDMGPGNLILEVTETSIMHDPESASKMLLALQSLGIKLSIDDFGTGHSSLIYLKTFPIHEIKFDRSFIVDINTSKESYNIVKSNIELAHILGAVTVAEGVESEEIRNTLVELNCDYIQGFHIAKPMPVTELVNWLKIHQPLS